MGEIFKESTDFKITIDQAVHLVIYFKNPNHKFFISKLKDEQYAEYGKYFTIDAPRETRWNSFYTVCLSLVRSQKALQVSQYYILFTHSILYLFLFILLKDSWN